MLQNIVMIHQMIHVDRIQIVRIVRIDQNVNTNIVIIATMITSAAMTDIVEAEVVVEVAAIAMNEKGM